MYDDERILFCSVSDIFYMKSIRGDNIASLDVCLCAWVHFCSLDILQYIVLPTNIECMGGVVCSSVYFSEMHAGKASIFYLAHTYTYY